VSRLAGDARFLTSLSKFVRRASDHSLEQGDEIRRIRHPFNPDFDCFFPLCAKKPRNDRQTKSCMLRLGVFLRKISNASSMFNA
jgi:hypothetical protein